MTSIDAGMPMHVAFISPIVTNSARRSHDMIQSDVLLCRTNIQSSSDNTSMRVCLSLSFRECLCTPLLCCNACHSYACTAPKSILAQQKRICSATGRCLLPARTLTLRMFAIRCGGGGPGPVQLPWRGSLLAGPYGAVGSLLATKAGPVIQRPFRPHLHVHAVHVCT